MKGFQKGLPDELTGSITQGTKHIKTQSPHVVSDTFRALQQILKSLVPSEASVITSDWLRGVVKTNS